jgi:hypothetical protein
MLVRACQCNQASVFWMVTKYMYIERWNAFEQVVFIESNGGGLLVLRWNFGVSLEVGTDCWPCISGFR